MADDEELHRCVTQFMLDTCRCNTTTDYDAVSSLVHGMCGTSFNFFLGDNEAVRTGSSGEFYIKPALPCIGDLDVMVCWNSCIAIPSGLTPPTELPPRFQDIVTVYEIIDSDQPGYVYLQPSYTLTKQYDSRYVVEKKEYCETASELLPMSVDLESNKVFENTRIKNLVQHLGLHVPENSLLQTFMQSSIVAVHGPALKSTNFVGIQESVHGEKLKEFVASLNSRDTPPNYDLVPCMRCLLWPPQAAEWPKRSRYQGWPNTETVNSIVINGCDVVHAVHPSCKQDEWTIKYQWRLSFSRAEVTLLNSWTPVQQLIYHMLRFVLKHGVSPKTSENSSYLSKLSNYHIKTLMLWECEQKPQTWWSVESSLIKLCSALLQKLSDWISKKFCQHYFVSRCNLLGHFVEDACVVICNSLERLADASVLLKWFVENYIRKVAHCCPAGVSELFEDILSTGKSETAINVVTGWKSIEAPFEQFRDSCIMFEIHTLTLFQTFHPSLAIKIRKFHVRQWDYVVAVASLRVAVTVSIHGLSEDLLEVLWELFGPCTAAIATSSLTNERIMYIRKAIKLATLSSVRSNALEMLHDEMSKAYLHYSFTCGLESTYQVVHILLAALHYKSLQYQQAIDHCKQVLNQRDREQDSAGTIGAEYLPQIDERVDAVFGLIMLYEHVLRNAISSYEQSQLDSTGLSVLTIELLARYLNSQCSTTVNTKSCEVIAAYRQHLFQSKRPLLSDVLLFKAVEIEMKKCTNIPVVEIRTAKDDKNSSGSMNTTLLVTMLEQVALEKLIVVRHRTIRELSSERFPLVNEFEVLYAYKCGLIEECLEMCRRNVGMLLRGQYQMYPVVYPELLSLLDGELVSLFGIIRMLHPTSLLLLQPHAYLIPLLTFSLYLMVQCLRKLYSDPPMQDLQLFRFVYDKVIFIQMEDYVFNRLVLKLTYRLLKLWQVKDRRDLLSQVGLRS